MTTTPQMNLVLPTEGGSSNVWDVILDVAFGLIDSHDHSTGQGVQVPTAGLNINGDLSFAGFSLTHLKRVALDEQASTPGNKSIWTSDADHDLYWTNSSGVDVKITDGSTLNVSIVGGIGGDYSSVGALLSYDDATRRYLLQQEGSPRPWAGLATADIDLYEKAASITNRVRLASPAALAASYTLTLPPATPATTVVIASSSSGVLQFGLTKTDNLLVPAAAADGNGGVRVTGAHAIKAWQINSSVITFPIPLQAGDVISSYRVLLHKDSDNTHTISAQMYVNKLRPSNAGGEAAIGSGCTDNENAPGDTSITESVSVTLASGGAEYDSAYVAVYGGFSTDCVYGIVVTYSRAF